MNITFRTATSDDIEFARDAHHRGYHDTVIDQFGSWDEAQQDQFFEATWYGAPHDIIFVDGIPCGFVCLEDKADHIYIRELVIHEDFQGRGIGTGVLKHVMNDAQGKSLGVKLGVLHKNSGAEKLYARMGFVQYDKTDSHVLMELNP